MPLYTKPNTYLNGAVISASEVNANEDQLYTAINGGLDEDNLSGGTQIPGSYLEDLELTKVLTYAADDAEYLQSITAGDSGTPSLPGTMQDELWRLRYRIGANKGYYLSTQYFDTAGDVQTASWIEPPIIGPQLLPNNGFEVHPLGTPNAPTGWTLLGTPSTVAHVAAAQPSIGLNKRSLNIVTDAADEGIQITIPGLKASTKYLIGVAYNLTAGRIRLTTEGSLGSGEYQHLNFTDTTASASASTVEMKQGIVKTTSTPASITIKIFGTYTGAVADNFDLIQVWMHELSDARPFELPHLAMQTATDNTSATTPSTFTSSQWNWQTRTALSLSQYVPYPGYRLIYEVQLSVLSSGTANDIHKHAFRLQVDGATVEGPHIKYFDSDSTGSPEVGDIITLKHVLENPAPGATYAFTVDVGAYNGGGDHSQVTINPLLNSLQSVSSSRLIVERL